MGTQVRAADMYGAYNRGIHPTSGVHAVSVQPAVVTSFPVGFFRLVDFRILLLKDTCRPQQPRTREPIGIPRITVAVELRHLVLVFADVQVPFEFTGHQDRLLEQAGYSGPIDLTGCVTS